MAVLLLGLLIIQSAAGHVSDTGSSLPSVCANVESSDVLNLMQYDLEIHAAENVLVAQTGASTEHPDQQDDHAFRLHDPHQEDHAPHDLAPHQEDDHTSHDSHDISHTPHAQVALLVLFGTLAVGCAIALLLERFAHGVVPYTVALFVAGSLVAIVNYFKSPDSAFTWPTWVASLEVWQTINPHLIFYVFLPGLLFGEAMRLNVTLTMKRFWQVLLLACPGVLMGTFLTACVAKFIFPYGWDWPISLVFGTILSATDPVAVVAIFGTLGVSPSLTTLISGESLLNDGTAIVIFTLMLKVVMGASLGFLDVVSFFVRMTIFSSLLGVALGLITVHIIGRCAEAHYHEGAMIQVTMTLVCGYLAFFLGENEFGTSGVLTVVVAGFVVGYYSWPRFVSRETVSTAWELIEFVGNTLIFFLAGVLFTGELLDRWHLITSLDFLLLLVLFVMLTLIRLAMICVLWVPLNAAGSPVHWTEGLVMVWSGLRGAVGLCLAIMVELEPSIHDQRATRIMFHVGGIATMTLLVNATTVPMLLRTLGITKTSKTKQGMLEQISAKSAQHATEILEAQLRNPDDVRFKGINSDIVRSLVPALKSASLGNPAKVGDSTEDEAAVAEMYRECYLHIVQKQYWEAIEHGILPRNSRAARLLLRSTDQALGDVGCSLNDWAVIARDVEQPKQGSWQMLVEKHATKWFLSWLPQITDQTRDMRAVCVALCFRDAHSKAQEEMSSLFAKEDKALQQVTNESVALCEKAEELLQTLPELVEHGKSEMLSRMILHKQLDEVAQLQERKLLTAAEAEHLLHGAHEALDKIATTSMSKGMAHIEK